MSYSAYMLLCLPNESLFNYIFEENLASTLFLGTYTVRNVFLIAMKTE
jgi:hypothetical protein